MPRILERRSAAEEISRIARERHARLDAKAEADHRRTWMDAAAVAIQKAARGRLVRTGLQVRAEAVVEAKAVSEAAADTSAAAAAAAAEARATAMALRNEISEGEGNEVQAAERLLIAGGETNAEKAELELAADSAVPRGFDDRLPLEALKARDRKARSPTGVNAKLEQGLETKGPGPQLTAAKGGVRGERAPWDAGDNLDDSTSADPLPRFTLAPTSVITVGGLTSPPAGPVRPDDRELTKSSSAQALGGPNLRVLTPELKQGMQRKIENAMGNPRLYRYFLINAIENKLPTDAGLQNAEKQRLSVESAEHHLFLDRIAIPFDISRSRPSTVHNGGDDTASISTSITPLFAHGKSGRDSEGTNGQVDDFAPRGSVAAGRIVTPIIEVKIDPAVAGRISGVDEMTATVAGDADAIDLRLRISSSFIATSNELWWTVDVIDKADLMDEAAARMYRVDMRPWQLAENGLDGLATIADFESDAERNILIDKLLVFLVNGQRKLFLQQQRQQQTTRHLDGVEGRADGSVAAAEAGEVDAKGQTRKVWSQMADSSTGYMYYVNELTGLCQWATPSDGQLKETYSPIQRAVAAKQKLILAAKEDAQTIKTNPTARAAAQEADAHAMQERQDLAKRLVELENSRAAATTAVPDEADVRSLLQQLMAERQRREEVEKALWDAEEVAASKQQIPQEPWICDICQRSNNADVESCSICGAAPGRLTKQPFVQVNAVVTQARSEADDLRKALDLQQLQSKAERTVDDAAAAAARGIERSTNTAQRRRSRRPLKSPEYSAMRSGLERLQKDLRQQDRQQQHFSRRSSSNRGRPRSRALSSDDEFTSGYGSVGQRALTGDGSTREVVKRLESEQRLFSERMSLLVRQIRSMLGEDEGLDDGEDEQVGTGVTFQDVELEAEDNLASGGGLFFGGADVGDFEFEGQRDNLTPLTPGTDRSDRAWAGHGGNRGRRRSKSEGSDRPWSGPRAHSADSDMAVAPDHADGTSNGDDEPLDVVLASQVEMSESVLILLQQLQDMQAVSDGASDKGKAAAMQSERRRPEGRLEGRPFTSPAQMSRPAHRTSLDTVPVPHDVRANSRGGTSEILFIVDLPFGPDGTYDERQEAGDWLRVEESLMELDESARLALARPTNFRSGGGLYRRTMFPKLSTVSAFLGTPSSSKGESSAIDKDSLQRHLQPNTSMSISLAHNPTLSALDKSATSVRPLFGLPFSHNMHATRLLPDGVAPAIDSSRGPVDAAAAAAARTLFADETTLLSARGVIEVSNGGEYDVEPETGDGLWWSESRATAIDNKLDLSRVVAYRKLKLESAQRVEATVDGRPNAMGNVRGDTEIALDTSRSAEAAKAARSVALASAGLLEGSETVRVSNDAKEETQKLLLTMATRAQTFLELLSVVKGLKLKPTSASAARRENRLRRLLMFGKQGIIAKGVSGNDPFVSSTTLEVGSAYRGLTVATCFPFGSTGGFLGGFRGQLIISRGHIRDFLGDAVVNIADARCMGGGDPAIDGAVASAGGPELHIARKKLPVLEVFTPPGKKEGGNDANMDPIAVRCRPGNAVLTIGGQLDAKYVIHAVGPNYWDYEPAREREGLPLYTGGAKAGDRVLVDAMRAAIGVARAAPLPKHEGGSGIQLLSAICSLAIAPMSLNGSLRGPKRDLYTLVELQLRAILDEIMGRRQQNSPGGFEGEGKPYTQLQEIHLVGSRDEEIEAMVLAGEKFFGELLAEACRDASCRAHGVGSTAMNSNGAQDLATSSTRISINTPLKESKATGKMQKSIEKKAASPPSIVTCWNRKTIEAASIVRSPTMMRLTMPRSISPELMSKMGAEVGRNGTISMTSVHLLEAKARAYTYLTHQTSRYECGLWLRERGRVARGLPAEDTPEAMVAFEAKREAQRPRTLLELALEGSVATTTASQQREDFQSSISMPINTTTREDTPPPLPQECGHGTRRTGSHDDSLRTGGAAGSLEGSLTHSYEEETQSKASSSVHTVSNTEIETTFRRYDHSSTGSLNTFELGAAIEELTGRKLAYKELARIVSLYKLGVTNSVSLEAFALLVRERNWASNDLLSQEDCYDVNFLNQTLGFRVRTVPERGVIVVNRIVDATNFGRVGLGDVVLAVNGAPLGWVQAHTELADAVRCLPRPVKITFRRGLNTWTGLPDVQWSESQLTELFQKYARPADNQLLEAPFSEHLGAGTKELTPRHLRIQVVEETPASELDIVMPGRRPTQKEIDERAAKEQAAKEAAERATKEAKEAYRVVVTDWVMDVFCLEPALSEIYGRSIPTLNISEMVLQLHMLDDAERAVIEVSDFIYIVRNLIVNDTYEREPLEIGPGKLMPGGKLHPSAKALFIPWDIETSVPPSPLVHQPEDGPFPGAVSASNVSRTLSRASSTVKDQMNSASEEAIMALQMSRGEYFEVVFRAVSLGFRICNAVQSKNQNGKQQGERMLRVENELTNNMGAKNGDIGVHRHPLEVLVKDVPDEDLAQFVRQADSIVAVNGAPLGAAGAGADHKILAAHIRSLPRPVRITFRRNDARFGHKEELDGADMLSIPSIESSNLGEHDESMWHDGDPV